VTTIPNFDIATDLKVEFYLPDEASNLFIIGISKLGSSDVLAGEGLFTIGVSLIGGTDVLGDSQYIAFTWQDLGCIVSKAQLSLGGLVQDQLYFQPEPASAQLLLQSLEYDPTFNSSFRPGVPVRIRLSKGAVDQIIWSGVIDNIATTFDQNGNNLMRLVAFDNFKRLMNSRIDNFDSTTGFPGFVSPYEQLELVAAGFGTQMNSASIDGGGEIPSTILTDVIPSPLVYEAIQVGLGLFWLDPATQEFVFIPRPNVAIAAPGTPIIGNNHGEPNHLCMTDIQANASEDTVYNSLKVILQSDDTINTLRENTDSIELYGKYAQDVTLNTTDLAELNRWADAVFQQSATASVQTVETLTLDRLGNLTEAAFFTPGQQVGVKYTEGIIEIDDYFTTTKVSHYIDPDNWLTTLEVWKEA
jgi:hypothetical protein